MERLLAARLGDAASVGSAGTNAVVGAPIYPLMADWLEWAGVPADGFAARQITSGLINSSDLILTATTAHRSAIVAREAAALRYTFTLLEFAHAVTRPDAPPVGGLPAGERIGLLAEYARRARPRLLVDQDIIDPYGRDDQVYQQAFALIDEAVAAVAYALTS